MPDYRRWFVPGGTYFFTVVTCRRYPFFRDPKARRMLGKAFRDVKSECPFQMFAVVRATVRATHHDPDVAVRFTHPTSLYDIKPATWRS